MALPAQTVDAIRHLLAELFGEKNQLGAMGNDSITPEMMPQELTFERTLLRAFYECEQRDDTPIPEKIAFYCQSADPHILKKVQEVEKLKNPQYSMLKTYAAFVKTSLEQEMISRAASKIERIAKMDYADSREQLSLMMDQLIGVPIQDENQALNAVELMDHFQEIQQKRVERHEKGQALGAVFPFHGLSELVPVLADGDVTLFTAPRKFGKSTVNMIMADYNAVQNDIDVLVLLMETSPETIEERILARELLIPTAALKKGIVDLKKPPYLKYYQNYVEQKRDLWERFGHVTYQYVAGAKVSDIAAKIRIHKRMADVRNRPLLVIIDYLQRIPEIGGKSTVESIAYISHAIKNMAMQYHCHIMLISQESLSPRGSSDSRSHGSNTPIFISQVQLAMRAINANRDVLVTDDDSNPMKNMLGQDRYWQRSGARSRQSVVRFDILLTNDNETGNCFVAFENNLFISQDLSYPNIPISSEFRQMIATFDSDLLDDNRKLV